MINMINAQTMELDDVAIAVEEILQQLDLKNTMLAHTAGYITCHPEFLETGVVQALCEALPFDVVGSTTLGNAVNGQMQLSQLCLSMLTSEDVTFTALLTEPLSEEDISGIDRVFAPGGRVGTETPGLILAFLPFIRGIGGEYMLKRLDAAAAGCPVFGATASDPSEEMDECMTIHNGRGYKRAATLLCMSGNVRPKFFVASLSEGHVQKQRAIITKSSGNLIEKINDVSVREYMQGIGLSKGDGIEGMVAIPFVFDLNDGTQPVTWAIYMLTGEGYAACGGDVPVNSTLAVGTLERDDVLQTAADTIAAVLQEAGTALLLFPCLGRNMVLGFEPFAEIEVIESLVGTTLPYHLSYANGELCPVYTQSGETRNRFHNFTFIACVV